MGRDGASYRRLPGSNRIDWGDSIGLVKQKGSCPLPRNETAKVVRPRVVYRCEKAFRVPVCRLMGNGSVLTLTSQCQDVIRSIAQSNGRYDGYQVGIASRTETGGCILVGESFREQVEQPSLLNVERSWSAERPISGGGKGNAGPQPRKNRVFGLCPFGGVTGI